MTDLLAAARAEHARLAAEVARLRAEEQREIKACAKVKEPIGLHYWQPRHDAEQRLWTAKALMEALS